MPKTLIGIPFFFTENLLLTGSVFLEVFEKSLAHEKYVTKRIHDLYALAVKEKDYAAQNHLQWFIDEQVEEEASFTEIVENLKLIGDSPMGLFQLNAQLGKRE